LQAPFQAGCEPCRKEPSGVVKTGRSLRNLRVLGTRSDPFGPGDTLRQGVPTCPRAHWRFFGAPCPRSGARRRKVEKCPARGGITISKGLAGSCRSAV
jgi:hypothetical protein